MNTIPHPQAVKPDYHEIFFVEGLPIAQPRTKHWARKDKDGKIMSGTTNPDTADSWKGMLAIGLNNYRPPEKLLGPVSLSMHFSMPRPKGHFKTHKGQPTNELKSSAPEFHIARPDQDNLDKAVMDVMENLGFYRNDSQACLGSRSKRYHGEGVHTGVMIEIRDLS